MDRIADILNSICREAFSDAGYDPAYGKAGVSNRPDLCEYQCNGAMALAKTAHKAPLIIAEEITERLKAYPQFSKVEAVRPGFINMDLDKAFLSSYLADMDRDERLGLPLPEEPETIIVDYGGANVAKPLHIGHLRSAIIGESVKRIGRAMGHHMIGDVHLGDWGLQMGLIIEELRDRGMEDFTLSDLEEIYPAASARSKEKDESGRISALTSNMAALNELRTSILGDAVEAVDQIDTQGLAIPVGNLTGINFFSGRGFELPVEVVTVGSAHAVFQSQFSDAGINQTRHQILLEIKVSVDILLPGGDLPTEISAQVPVAETVIVGGVPDTYVEFPDI